VAYTSSAVLRALVCSGLKQAINLSCLGASPSSVNADSGFWAQLHSSLIEHCDQFDAIRSTLEQIEGGTPDVIDV